MNHVILDALGINDDSLFLSNTILIHDKGAVKPFAAFEVTQGVSKLTVGQALPSKGYHVELDN